MRGDIIEGRFVATVSMDGRGSEEFWSMPGLPLFLVHNDWMVRHIMPKKVDVAFFILLQSETLSSSTFTLSHPTSRCTGALLSSWSIIVRR